MLDLGLLITGVMIWVGLAAAARWAPVDHYQRAEVLDSLYWPLIAGVLSGRLFAAALDDPASLTSIRALLVVRGGVEFWAGVAVLLATLSWTTRRRHRRQWAHAVAELAAFALWTYAIYEAGCVYRDGCYGPASPIGLVPDGLQERQVPVGIVVAVAVGLLGILVWHLSNAPPAQRVLLAIGGVAATRAVASVWLPRLGDGLTRQHVESIGVGLIAAAALVWSLARPRDSRLASESPPAEPRGPGYDTAS